MLVCGREEGVGRQGMLEACMCLKEGARRCNLVDEKGMHGPPYAPSMVVCCAETQPCRHLAQAHKGLRANLRGH